MSTNAETIRAAAAHLWSMEAHSAASKLDFDALSNEALAACVVVGASPRELARVERNLNHIGRAQRALEDALADAHEEFSCMVEDKGEIVPLAGGGNKPRDDDGGG